MFSGGNNCWHVCRRTPRHIQEEFNSNWQSNYNCHVICETAIQYLFLDKLVFNISGHFTDGAVELIVSSPIFNPASIPTEDSAPLDYGNQQLQIQVNFYGKEAIVECDVETYTSLPLVDGEEIFVE